MKRLPILQLTFFLLAAVCFACSNVEDDAAYLDEGINLKVGNNGDKYFLGTWFIDDQQICEANLTKVYHLTFDRWPAKKFAELVITDADHISLIKTKNTATNLICWGTGYTETNLFSTFHHEGDSLQMPEYSVIVDTVSYDMTLVINPEESSLLLTTSLVYEMNLIIRLKEIILKNENETRHYPTTVAARFETHKTSSTLHEEE